MPENASMHATFPHYRSAAFLKEHIFHTMSFYHPRCIDRSGGFFHFFKDDGTVYDPSTRHLVNSTRFIFNYAMAHIHFRAPTYLDAVHHGLRFLREAHLNPQTGRYAWTLRVEGDPQQVQVLDETEYAYGLGFVLLAYAHALMAGVQEARGWVEETWTRLNERFWEPGPGLYADECAPDGSLRPYRGQDANMHICEALLAAYEATSDVRYLDRAEQLARNITLRQADLAGGLIWEHYRADWSVDWDFHRDQPELLFRAYGFQIGHQSEWAKLLLILNRLRPQDWLVARAQSLFDAAMARGWDETELGLRHRLGPDGITVIDERKFFWTQAESIAAAALLGQRTGLELYWRWFDRLWSYAWTYFIDHEHGAWFHTLSRDNRKIGDEKGQVGKTDYHTLGACYLALKALPA